MPLAIAATRLDLAEPFGPCRRSSRSTLPCMENCLRARKISDFACSSPSTGNSEEPSGRCSKIRKRFGLDRPSLSSTPKNSKQSLRYCGAVRAWIRGFDTTSFRYSEKDSCLFSFSNASTFFFDRSRIVWSTSFAKTASRQESTGWSPQFEGCPDASPLCAALRVWASARPKICGEADALST